MLWARSFLDGLILREVTFGGFMDTHIQAAQLGQRSHHGSTDS